MLSGMLLIMFLSCCLDSRVWDDFKFGYWVFLVELVFVPRFLFLFWIFRVPFLLSFFFAHKFHSLVLASSLIQKVYVNLVFLHLSYFMVIFYHRETESYSLVFFPSCLKILGENSSTQFTYILSQLFVIVIWEKDHTAISVPPQTGWGNGQKKSVVNWVSFRNIYLQKLRIGTKHTKKQLYTSFIWMIFFIGTVLYLGFSS